MRKLILVFVAVIFATLASIDCANAQLLVGVGTHMGQGKQSISKVNAGLAVVGAKTIRDEVYWDALEPSPGRYSISRVPDQLTSYLKSASDGVLVLGYGNPNYDNGSRPTTSDAVLAFANYAREVASEFGGTHRFLEIWNEWNLPTGYRIRTSGSSDDYVNLARATANRLRRSGFSGKILIGGVGGDWPDWNFTQNAANAGLLSLADGYSVHLYNFARSGDVYEMIERLDRLQIHLRRANGGLDYPVYVTEVGWPTHLGKNSSTEFESGNKIASFLLAGATRPWLKGVWLYELFDKGGADTDPEAHFGLLHQDGTPKARTCAVASAISIVSTHKVISSGLVSKRIRWVRFSAGDHDLLVVLANTPSEVIVPASYLRHVQAPCSERVEASDAPESGMRILSLSSYLVFSVPPSTRGEEFRAFGDQVK